MIATSANPMEAKLKSIAAVLLFLSLFSAEAHAQSIPSIPTCFPRLAGLASKLSVHPSDPNNAPAILVAACNGKNYDLIQLIDALLMKMEKTAKK